MRLVKPLGRSDEGGSCSICSDDYIGVGIEQFYPEEKKGYRVLIEYEDLIVEPANMCERCFKRLKKQEQEIKR